MAVIPPSPPPSSPTPLPIQFTPFHKEDFAKDSGVAFVNQTISQLTTTLNSLLGAGGPAILPAGVDVRGGTLTGLGPPASPTDAVSAGHANANFGYAAQQGQLDVGKPYALKGLSYAYGQSFANSQSIATIQKTLTSLPPSPYGGAGHFLLFGLLIQFGFIANMDTAVFPMSFPVVFPTACQSIVAATTGPTDRITYVVSFSASQFTLANNGAGAGATWIAVGW